MIGRHESILALLQTLRQVAVSELSQRLGVSPVTIRKDLSALEAQGLVQRSHGGARLAQSIHSLPPIALRQTEQAVQKRAIALKVAELVQDSDSVCIDAGTTTALAAEALKNHSIQVITNSLEIIRILGDSPTVALTVLGGGLRKEAQSLIGPLTIASIAGLRFDLAIVGATGFTLQGEFYSQNTIEAEVKRALLEASKRRIIIADSSKFEAKGFARFAEADLVDLLVTDGTFAHAAAFRGLGIEVLLA